MLWRSPLQNENTPPDAPDAPDDADLEPRPEPSSSSANLKISVVICLVIVAVAAGLAVLTFTTEPTAKRGGATKETAMLVDVLEVERATYRPTINATGTVQASEDIVVRPQVGGRIIARGDNFIPGGFVEKGDLLVKLEQADYRNALAQRESELSQARADLAIEMGRQKVARSEYEFYDKKLEPEESTLILREPQLEVAKKRVDAAQAAVDQARLDLARTTVRSPVDAHIVRRDVNVGSQVSPSDSLGRLVGMNTYWVAVEIPLHKLRWVNVPEDEGEAGASFTARNRASWPEGTYRHGELYRLVGMLGGDTRMAQILGTIVDPHGREPGPDGEERPRLIIGEYVEVTIEGDPIEASIKLDRDYVRDNDTVWTMVDGELSVKEVEVAFRDATHAYITSGLDDGARVVTTNISSVRDGAPLRLRGAAQEPAEAEGDAQ